MKTTPVRDAIRSIGCFRCVSICKCQFKAKIAFLTDGRAICYAETYIGMIEHYKLAEIVGGPTAGTNGNVNPLRCPAATTLSGRA
jgi:hypothetical protein